MLPGDAVVRHDDTRKHIFLVGATPDDEGLVATYECVGCEDGCRTQRRRTSALSKWTAIRHADWPDS